MVDLITADDVASWVSGWSDTDVALLVAGLNAKATRVAPCLADNPSAEVLAEAKLILVGAIKRWAEAGSGAFSQNTAGPWSVSVDTRQRSGGYNLWPSEIVGLQELCAEAGGADEDAAFMVDMTGVDDYKADLCKTRPDLRLQWCWPPGWVAGTDIPPRVGGGRL